MSSAGLRQAGAAATGAGPLLVNRYLNRESSRDTPLLRTPEAGADYLNNALADGDPAEVRDALNLVARALGMSEVTKAAGVTRRGLRTVFGNLRELLIVARDVCSLSNVA
ncbi:helix-turn-helix domain-containing transcriptional regulator [Bradyrhizobium sp. USDA 3364]